VPLVVPCSKIVTPGSGPLSEPDTRPLIADDWANAGRAATTSNGVNMFLIKNGVGSKSGTVERRPVAREW